MASAKRSLAGSGYVILNAIRVLNIIALLASVAASVAMLIKTSTNSALFFFDAMTNVISAFFATFLILSELNLFKSYFARNMPLLGPEHGFVTLALAMVVLGIDLLAKLNHAQNSQERLGLAFWRVVISAGVIIFVLAFVNFVSNFIFRDRKQGITARQVRAHGAVAKDLPPPASAKGSVGSPFKTPVSEGRTPVMATNNSNNNNGPTTSGGRNPLRLITDPMAMFGDSQQSQQVRADPILPSYHASTDRGHGGEAITMPPMPEEDNSGQRGSVSPSSRYSRATNCNGKKTGTGGAGVFGGFHFGTRRRESLAPPLPINISAPMGVNPQFAHLVSRPDSAMHPAKSNEREPFRWRVSRGLD